jgi:hypothetical protein
MANATTDRAQFISKATQYGFDLKPGTTFEQARQIAEYLNQNIDSITRTLF